MYFAKRNLIFFGSAPAVVAPAPTFSSVSPNRGLDSGGTAITITGSNFVATPTVTIGGAAATSIVFVNSTTLTAVTPAGSVGTANIVITNPDAQTVTGTAAYTYSTWQNNKTISFARASSQYINLGNNVNDEYNQTWSWGLWVKFTTIPGQMSLIGKMTGAGGGYKGFLLDLDGTGASAFLDFFIENTITTKSMYVHTVNTYTTATWYFIVVTTDGTGTAAGARIYVNGVNQSLTTVWDNLAGNSIVNTTPLTFAADDETVFGDFLNGLMGQVTHWSIALSQAQVTTLYNSGTPIDPQGTAFGASCDHLWPLGIPSDTIAANGILDRVGSVTGTPVNTPTISSTAPPA